MQHISPLSNTIGNGVLVLDAEEYIKEDLSVKLRNIVFYTKADLLTLRKLYFYFIMTTRKKNEE
jgi:hypothetical protein